MTALLDLHTADKLAKVCSLFASEHDGERANAAALADKMVRSTGLTWQSLLIPKREPETIEAKIDFALHNGAGILDAWEEGFLRGIRGRQFLTEKQLSKLSCIAAKARAFAEHRP